MPVKIELGATYEDVVFKIKGIATAHTRYLTGCDRVALDYVKEGEVKTYWADVSMLKRISGPTRAVAKAMKASAAKDDLGGPGAVAPSRDPAK